MRLLAAGALGTLLGLIVLRAEALTYFVSISGSDTNGGSFESPFRTLHYAASTLLPGDTCYLRGGTYRETLTPVNSGTAIAPITFAAWSNETVTISALDVVSEWEAESSGVYSAPVDWDLGNGYNQVFADGAMTHQARIPDYGGGDCFHPAAVGVTVGGSQNNVIYSAAWSGHPANYWAGAWFCGGIDARWSWQCARVVSSSGNTVTLEPSTKSNPWFGGSGYGFLWGLRSMLDGDNEWHLSVGSSGNQLKLHLPGGVNPADHTVEMKRRNWCINFNGLSYIQVSGLQLIGGAVWLNGSNNVLQNCRARFLSHFMNYVWGYAYDGDVPQGSGILIDGTSNTVHGCTISDTAGSGIISTGNDNLIERNHIFNTDYSGTYGCGIRLAGLRNQVSYNSVHTSGRDILQPGGSGHSIFFNDFYSPALMCQDTGVLYIWGVNGQCPTGARTRLAYNWFHDNYGSGPTPLVYLDNWCRNFVIDHNVIWDNGGDSGLRVNRPAAGHLIYNNTLFNCDDVGTHTYDMWPNYNPDAAFWTSDLYQYSSANNLYLGGAPQSQLADWVHSDFRLRPSSPAINAGVAIPGYTDWFPLIGVPDKGACEYGSTVWKAGVDGWCQPKLSVVASGNGTVRLSAPPEAAFFQLQVSTHSHPPVIWQPVTNAPTVSLTEWSVTLDIPAGESPLFRLQSK
jgi:hypothetical protein